MSDYLNNHGSNKKSIVLNQPWKKRAEKFSNLFSRYLPKSFDEKIIDIGCSTGQIVGWLQSTGYKNASGVDSDKSAISYGQSVGIKNLNLDDLFAYCENLNDDSIKLFILRDITEHLSKKEVETIISIMSSKLKLDGYIWIQTPNGLSPAANSLLYGDWTHRWLMTPSSIKQLFANDETLNLILLKGAHIKIFRKINFLQSISRSILSYVYKFFIASLTSINISEVFVEGNLIAVVKKIKKK